MGLIRCPVDIFGLTLFVIFKFVLQMKDGNGLFTVVAENDVVPWIEMSGLFFGDGKGNGEGPRGFVFQTQGLHDRIIILFCHESLEGREGPAGDHVEVTHFATVEVDLF